MGFFSWKCAKTGHPILAAGSFHVPSELSEVVLVLPNNAKLEGEYNGYGRVKGISIFPLIWGALKEPSFKVDHASPDKLDLRMDKWSEEFDAAPEGWDLVMQNVKMVRKDHYAGESFSQLPVSDSDPQQGLASPEEVQELFKTLPPAVQKNIRKRPGGDAFTASLQPYAMLSKILKRS